MHIYWERLLAHSHWFTVSLFGREVHLCSRCSGIFLGFMALRTCLFMLSALYVLPFLPGFFVALLLALPSIVDWSTQSLGFRSSTHCVRLSTGFLEGIGISFLGLLDASTLVKFLAVAGIGLSVVVTGSLGRRFMASPRVACEYH